MATVVPTGALDGISITIAYLFNESSYHVAHPIHLTKPGSD